MDWPVTTQITTQVTTTLHTFEVPGASHAVYVSHPKEVAAAIEDAALHAH